MKIFSLTLTGLIALAFMGCQKEASQSTSNAAGIPSGKKPVAAYNCSDYEVVLGAPDKTTQPGYTIFTWTITNPAPGNGSGNTLQNLSHWDFVPSACLDENWQDFVAAAYNSGDGWVNISPLLIEPDNSLSKSGCNENDVFKFAQGTMGSQPTQYRVVLKGNWSSATTTAYFKSGANTGCCSKEIQGVGCREDEECSFSQGYWFASNSAHTGGVHPWGTTVTIGGYTYTNAEGLAIWNASNQGGIKDAKKAFTQLAAIRLSGVSDPALDAAVATIENWLSQYGAKLTDTNLRNQTSAEISAYGDANAAAGFISNWINANHCN